MDLSQSFCGPVLPGLIVVAAVWLARRMQPRRKVAGPDSAFSTNRHD